MRGSLGLVEIQGLSTAILAADQMVKAADVEMIEIENTKGLGYMTIKVAGDVGAVNAAVSVGKQVGELHQKLISYKVIARPSDSMAACFAKTKTDKARKQQGMQGSDVLLKEAEHKIETPEIESVVSQTLEAVEETIPMEPEAEKSQKEGIGKTAKKVKEAKKKTSSKRSNKEETPEK